MADDFEIRLASADDLSALTDLLHQQMIEHAIPADANAIASAIAAALHDPRLGQLLVASVEGQVTGVAYVASLHSIEHAGTISILEELYVAPAFRGHGLGTALLRRVIDDFCDQPKKPMELEVDATHQSVESFYQRHGFTRRARTRWLRLPA